MKKIIAILLAAATLTTAVCAKPKATKVGVSMPTKDLQRWNQDGSNMKSQLERSGYTVDLQYAANDIPTQVSQIENMITGGCKVLVIASIDGSSLSNVLEQARKKKVQVIAYDPLAHESVFHLHAGLHVLHFYFCENLNGIGIYL